VIKLEIGNSYSKITGLSAKQEKELREALSYIVGGSSAYYSGFGVRKKSLLNKKGEFPSGLLWRTEVWLKNQKINWCRIEKRQNRPLTIPRRLVGLEVTPYKDQLEAVKKAELYGHGTISMPTGTGKSLVIALIAARLNVKTLVIVPSIEIKKQLSESISDALGPSHKVTVENIDSRRLNKLTDFDCLIIDEAHHSAAKTYQKLNKTAWTGIYYRFFMTATPFRNDTEETLLFEAIAGQVIYKLDYKTAVKNKYIVPIEAFYIDLPKHKNDYYAWQEVYKNLIVNNVHRNSIIFSLLFSLYEADKSTLCLVKEVQHGKNINYPVFVHGEDDETRFLINKFNNREIKGLVATSGMMGEGVDTKPCEYVIIAGLGKAKSQFMQAVGRAVRNYPGKESAKIIIFRDTSHKFTLRHFNAQKKILKEEYGVVVSKLEII